MAANAHRRLRIFVSKIDLGWRPTPLSIFAVKVPEQCDQIVRDVGLIDTCWDKKTTTTSPNLLLLRIVRIKRH